MTNKSSSCGFRSVEHSFQIKDPLQRTARFSNNAQNTRHPSPQFHLRLHQANLPFWCKMRDSHAPAPKPCQGQPPERRHLGCLLTSTGTVNPARCAALVIDLPRPPCAPSGNLINRTTTSALYCNNAAMGPYVGRAYGTVDVRDPEPLRLRASGAWTCLCLRKG